MELREEEGAGGVGEGDQAPPVGESLGDERKGRSSNPHANEVRRAMLNREEERGSLANQGASSWEDWGLFEGKLCFHFPQR